MWLAVWGCVAPEPTPDPPVEPGPETETGPSSPTVETVETGTASTADTATPGTTETYDCSAVPRTGTLVRVHEYVPGFEDFTFDADGYLWGVSTPAGDLVRVPYDGPPELLRPGIFRIARGTRFLPDGDLAVVDFLNNAVVRVDRTTFGTSLLTGSLSLPNGLAVGTDGHLFLSSTNGQVHRIDPATGASTRLVDSPTGADGITFAPDYERMYIGSDLDGTMATFVVDPDGEVTEPLSLFASLPAAADGMTMDRCGNAYVVLIGNGTIERVAPDGTHSRYAVLPPGTSTSINFGSGIGGWERDHLYVGGFAMPMVEIDAGVEGKPEPQYP